MNIRPKKSQVLANPGRGRCAPRRQSLLRSCLAARSFPRRPPAYVLSALGTPVMPIRLTPKSLGLGASTDFGTGEVQRPPLRNLGKYKSGEAPSCGGSPREGARSEARAEQRLAAG